MSAYYKICDINDSIVEENTWDTFTDCPWHIWNEEVCPITGEEYHIEDLNNICLNCPFEVEE